MEKRGYSNRALSWITVRERVDLGSGSCKARDVGIMELQIGIKEGQHLELIMKIDHVGRTLKLQFKVLSKLFIIDHHANSLLNHSEKAYL